MSSAVKLLLRAKILFLESNREFNQTLDPACGNSVYRGPLTIDPDWANAECSTGMNIIGQIVANMNAVARIFARSTASVLKNAWVRLAKAGVLGKSRYGEVF